MQHRGGIVAVSSRAAKIASRPSLSNRAWPATWQVELAGTMRSSGGKWGAISWPPPVSHPLVAFDARGMGVVGLHGLQIQEVHRFQVVRSRLAATGRGTARTANASLAIVGAFQILDVQGDVCASR